MNDHYKHLFHLLIFNVFFAAAFVFLFSVAASASGRPGRVEKLVSSDISVSGITLEWSGSEGADMYQLFMLDSESGKYVRVATTGKRRFTVEGLKKNSVYSFKIRGVSKKGNETMKGDFSPEFLEFTDTDKTVKTNAQAAKRVNSAINSAKRRSSSVLKSKKTVETEALSASKPALLMTISNLLNLFEGTRNESRTFKNGMSSGSSISSFIQPYGRYAALRGCDIKSFSFQRSKTDTTLKVSLLPDSALVDGKRGVCADPVSTSRVFSTVNITEKNIVPLEIVSGKQRFDGVRLSLLLGEKGELKAMTEINDVTVDAVCRVSSLKFDAKARYKITEKLVIS